MQRQQRPPSKKTSTQDKCIEVLRFIWFWCLMHKARLRLAKKRKKVSGSLIVFYVDCGQSIVLYGQPPTTYFVTTYYLKKFVAILNPSYVRIACTFCYVDFWIHYSHIYATSSGKKPLERRLINFLCLCSASTQLAPKLIRFKLVLC